MRLAIVSLSLVLAALVGCSSDSRNEQLQKQVAELQNQVKVLKAEVDVVKADLNIIKFDRETDGIAYLTPGSSGYDTIRTTLGPVTVSLEDVQPYANGSRVALRFGNLTYATLDNVSATLQWGQVDDKGMPRNQDVKSKDVNFTTPFRPGAWNTVQVVLDGVPPAQLGFVRVTNLNNKSIRLFK